MIDPNEFLIFLEKNFHLITGVPCSYFKDFLIHYSDNENNVKLKHVYATREDEAIGIASGVSFSGKKALVYMQNSGLGNIGDALTSLAQLYNLPMLLIISYRGLEHDKDFPEHSIMGELTEPFLKALRIPYWELTEKNWQEMMNIAIKTMINDSIPVAILAKKGVLSQ